MDNKLKRNAAITAVGKYVPDTVLTNEDFEKIVDTNSEWILSRTGIKQRGILKDPGLASAYLGTQAVQNLIEKSNLDPNTIDAIICATVTPDYVFPATANIIGHNVGAKNAFSFDLNAACSGFLFGLTMTTSLIESGRYKKIIMVGAEKMSSIIDYSDRTTCILFGDAAAAVLVEACDGEFGIKDSILRTDGVGVPYLRMKSGGSLNPASIESVLNKEHFVYQEGQTVFKYAVKGMADVSAEIMERNQLKAEDISWLVPHQANKRIIEATANRMGVSMDKVMLNIQNYGNTTAATIPLCLADWESQLKKGDNIILAAFGGGFTWGATWVKWAYNSNI